MNLSIETIKLAYSKLKTHIYYDSSDLFLREKLVEFETDTTKSQFSVGRKISDLYVEKSGDFFDIFNRCYKERSIEENLDLKFDKLLNELNDYNEENKYFKSLLDSINVIYLPKKISTPSNEDNFITNKKKTDSNTLEKVIAFIDMPIELHIISIIWINEYGVNFDLELLDECKGNRLILNKEKTNIIKNSSLFKPYFTQYQSWRDDSISIAQNLLKEKKDVIFINLDISDFFHSCRINIEQYFDKDDSINKILRKLHSIYSVKLAESYNFEDIDILKKEKKSLLPIGLLSSYVIANHHLNELDKIITSHFKPAYFGRYVDDILLVFSQPKENSKYLSKEYNLNFDTYCENNKKIKLSTVDKYILNNLYPLFKVFPSQNDKNIIKIDLDCYTNLICQSDKTMIYHFDHTESTMVIDKLKAELDQKSSEFRDLPDSNEEFESFDKNAYYLNYTDSEDKIRTLKDYKENRYGLTLYLTNKILGATKQKQSISDDEIKKMLSFFNGKNTIEFYRLWEKIFTYLLVSNKPNAYVDFYFQCIEESLKIELQKNLFENTKIKDFFVVDNLLRYLDAAHELVLSLNPTFLNKNKKVLKNFEYRSNQIEGEILKYFFNEITRPDSFWSMRYRKANMLRHQYVSIPLLNYTKESYEKSINLLSLDFKVEEYTIDDNLIQNSPRPIKFWECTISQLLTDLKESSDDK